MCQDAENGGGKNFVKAEPDEGAEPSPEQKFQFIEDKERNKDWAEQTDNGGGNGSVGDDGADSCGQYSNQHLNDEVDHGVIGIHERLHHSWPISCLCLIDGVLNAGCAVAAN